MAGGLAIGGDVCNLINYGAATGSTGLTAITAGAANTKGSYTQLTASTTVDISYVIITLTAANGNAILSAVDIAFGAAASEQVRVNNLMASPAFIPGPVVYAFPLSIPKGTCLSARCQSTTASQVTGVSIIGASSGFAATEGSCGIDSLGFTAGSTKGSAVGAMSGSTNTLSAYGQIISSTARNYTGIFGMIDFGTAGATTSNKYMVNIAIGAAASEQVRIPNLYYDSVTPAAGHEAGAWIIPYIPMRINSGTRIAANAQCSAGSANAPNVTLYGVY
jgi:hypothetical protein